MSDGARINVYDSQSADYHRAFQVFLDHTDQKVNARRWLDALVEGLPARRLYIDAGAGNGQVTAWFTARFERTIAIEPNPSLAAELRHACPSAELLQTGILQATPGGQGDLVLCSHVLYYVDRHEWLPIIDRMASWLAPGGVLAVVLQNHDTDCMRMLEAFSGRRFDLSDVTREFGAAHQGRYRIELQQVAAHVTAPELTTAYTVGEFMLNLIPLPNPPDSAAVESYILQHFGAAGGGFRFSCHQDILVIRPN
jgi:trans-aconitate methyltransferase